MIKLNPYTEEARLLLVQQVQMQMSEARFEHVLGVEQSAIALAKRYGYSVEKASIAALRMITRKNAVLMSFVLSLRTRDLT